MIRKSLILVTLVSLVLVVGLSVAAQSNGDKVCAGSPPTRLVGVAEGRVARAFSSLRDGIASFNIVRILPHDATVEILDGPVCDTVAANLTWWQVEYDGDVGWVSEGQDYSIWGNNLYWIEPVMASATATDLPAEATEEAVEATAEVEDMEAEATAEIEDMVAEATAEVADAMAEATDEVADAMAEAATPTATATSTPVPTTLPPTIDPNCYASPAPRLDGAPEGEVAQAYSSLREGIGSMSIIRVIPGGEQFDILDGPICSGPHYWYQVSYDGDTGWVSEGYLDTYWLEPVDLD